MRDFTLIQLLVVRTGNADWRQNKYTVLGYFKFAVTSLAVTILTKERRSREMGTETETETETETGTETRRNRNQNGTETRTEQKPERNN